MVTSRQDIQDSFSAELREKLRLHYRGRVPSAAVLAAQFNHRIPESESAISQETARRWLRGKCLPDQMRMAVLVNWLELNVQETFCSTKSPRTSVPMDDHSKELLELFSKIETAKKSVFLNLLRSSVIS